MHDNIYILFWAYYSVYYRKYENLGFIVDEYLTFEERIKVQSDLAGRCNYK